MVNDAMNTSSLGRYPVEDIRAPTFIIDTRDGSTFAGSEYTAAHIPNAKLLAYDTGGHFLIGHEADEHAALAEFLGAHAENF
jgi:2-hydroxy-6-oxonona-2,4-dienedioate hydrolase